MIKKMKTLRKTELIYFRIPEPTATIRSITWNIVDQNISHTLQRQLDTDQYTPVIWREIFIFPPW